jgi:acyl carrier protein
MYGPTETTIWSAVQHVQGEHVGVVPIGQPIANTQLHVLDSKLQPLPVGVPGDLYIGGDGLARGYLNRPELTGEKFSPNPFSSRGSRLYRTGDRARYLMDGTVDFLGRADFQVKIRGFRIELGEIEAVLRTVPGVREAIAVADGDDHRDKRLVVYLVAVPGASLEERELRRVLQLKLPDYMVPSIYVNLPELPLTPNGKVDRRALPAPAFVSSESREDFVAPSDPMEMEIAQLWQTLLEHSPIGVHDNFFELGGHSLLATQFLARLRSTFQVQVSLKTFFQEPTVSGIAKALEEVLLSEPEISGTARRSM